MARNRVTSEVMALKDFRQDLAGLRQQLDDERRRLAETARARRAFEAESQRNSQLFRNSVGDAVPLAPSDRAARPRPRISPQPRPSVASAQLAAVASLSDGPDGVEGAIEQGETFVRNGIDQRTLRRLRRGELPVNGQFDLHGMTRDQARNATTDFVSGALGQGWRCVRIIHGKGLGSADRTPVLKMLVRRWLRQSAQVLAFTDAPLSAGGSGALLVLLKPVGLKQSARD